MVPVRSTLVFERLADFVLSHRWLCLSCFALVTLLFLSGIPNLEIDNSLETLFLENDPQLRLLNATVREYGTELGMVVAFRPGEVFDNEFLRVLDRITRRIRDMETVENVYSLTHTDHIYAEGEEIRVGPLVPGNPVPPEKMAAIRKNALDDPFVTGQILSEDASTAALAIRFVHMPDEDSLVGNAVGEIRKILAEEAGGRFTYHLSGIVFLFTVMNDYCLKDLITFVPIGFLVVVLILIFVFRTLSGVLVTLGATLLTMIWTMGLMGLFRVPITVATTMLPVLIMVISVSDAVHLILQYYEGLAKGADKRSALRTAIYKVGTPCFLTSLTTAMGFSSLLLSELRPIRDFGLYAAIGIFFAFVIFIFLVPVILFSFETAPLRRADRLRTGGLTRLTEWIARTTHHHPVRTLGVAGLVMGLSVYGILKIRVDTRFTDYFYDSDPVMQSIHFIDRNLTGIEPLRILLDTGKEGGIKDPGFLRKVETLEAFLRDYPEISRVFALPDPLKRMHRLLHGDLIAYDRLPDSREHISQYLLLLSLAGGDELLDFLGNGEMSTAQVLAMFRLVGTKRQEEILRNLDHYLESLFGPSVSHEMTDAAALNPTLANRLVRSQIKTFSLAFFLVFSAMTLLFRSIRIGILSIIPNFVPLVLMAGLMGLSGISLNMVTVMVASIALGIAVDDTIHILARYRIEFQEGPETEGAMRRTLASSGRAVIFSSVVLTAGFLIPMFSQFRLPLYFGILAATTIAGALLGDLFILPSLLRLTRPFVKIRG